MITNEDQMAYYACMMQMQVLSQGRSFTKLQPNIAIPYLTSAHLT